MVVEQIAGSDVWRMPCRDQAEAERPLSNKHVVMEKVSEKRWHALVASARSADAVYTHLNSAWHLRDPNEDLTEAVVTVQYIPKGCNSGWLRCTYVSSQLLSKFHVSSTRRRGRRLNKALGPTNPSTR